MIIRASFCLMVVLYGASVLEPTLAASPLPIVRIGIVFDGPMPPHGWGKIFRSKLFPQEILELTRGEFNVQFPANKQARGDWTVRGVKQAVNYLLADPTVDLILALGCSLPMRSVFGPICPSRLWLHSSLTRTYRNFPFVMEQAASKI